MSGLSRQHIRIYGQVQGVGFRPFVYGLANRYKLTGWVANDEDGVQLEVQGEAAVLDRFSKRLVQDKPPLAMIDTLNCQDLVPKEEQGFQIIESILKPNHHKTSIRAGITPDAALCQSCLSELFDTQDRRYRYPFINCTHCGPRYTIIKALPYDRPNTTMAEFSFCEHCVEEYAEPSNRRFHAQPNACAECGPSMHWLDKDGVQIEIANPFQAAATAIQTGKIIAVKGLGGFHLVCDASHPQAVAELRKRKKRQAKPFAVMACNTDSISELVQCDPSHAELLQSSMAPAVLLPKTLQCDQQLPGVAPQLKWLGVMMPYAPVHYLLFHALAGSPDTNDWYRKSQMHFLVMTSANVSGDPLVYENDEAVKQLSGIADAFLTHNRDIHIRCDDSVIHGGGRTSSVIRRGRGLAPQAVRLASAPPSVLALGGWFKNTISLSLEDKAYVSHYIGDLDNAQNCRFLDQTVTRMQTLFQIQPKVVVRDLHPDFYSSQFADRFAEQTGCELIKVQHHHAHIASVMAEHRLTEPVIGLALDGVGLGEDGSLWGGELLCVNHKGYQRLGHFRPIPLPGGDRAAREPWRVAAGVLHDLGRGHEIAERFRAHRGADMLQQMMEKTINVPLTSSAGRLFDAAAGLLGVQEIASYEAQAAMVLESLVDQNCINECSSSLYKIHHGGLLDFYPLLEALANESDPIKGATLFHLTLVQSLSQWLLAAVEKTGVRQVVFAGGCFLNRYLRDQLFDHLSHKGLQVYEARQLPCNDSGLSLGQLWVAGQASL